MLCWIYISVHLFVDSSLLIRWYFLDKLKHGDFISMKISWIWMYTHCKSTKTAHITNQVNIQNSTIINKKMFPPSFSAGKNEVLSLSLGVRHMSSPGRTWNVYNKINYLVWVACPSEDQTKDLALPHWNLIHETHKCLSPELISEWILTY